MNKKVLLVSGLIILLGGFFVYEKFAVNTQTTTQVINTKQTPTSGNNNPPAMAVVLKDGTYTGNTTSSMYGPAQAQIIITAGKITDVNFLQYPSDRAASLRKSQMAMPVVKQEVIQSQSANVDTVSGATQTSESFIQSISSALSQAS